MKGQMEIREHLSNLLSALANISPSRNFISQLIFLLPRDLPTVEHSYPELIRSEAQEILEIFGVEFSEEVGRRADSFAEALHKFIHKVFDWLDEETARVNIAKIMDAPVSSIPNPYAEWARKVLDKFAKMSNGDKILRFLKILIERGSISVPYWQPFLDEVMRRLKINLAELEEILRLTVGSQREFIKEEVIRGAYISDKVTEYLVHSEYHLDLIVSRETRYDQNYLVRHQKTIKELLEEVKI